MEILLLKNYYTSLTFSAIGNSNVTEDVSQEVSPRYSRLLDGSYALADFKPYVFSPSYGMSYISYGKQYSSTSGQRALWFGSGTNPVTFNDYAPSTIQNVNIIFTRSSYTVVYDETTKTYTSTEIYTLTNNTDLTLEITEILLGAPMGYYGIAYIRELLGENSFTFNARESVKFELTIKYTIAEPLQ